MRIIESSNRRGIKRLVNRRQEVDPNLARRVARIVATVRGSGDEALLRYAQRFDQLAQPVEVSHQEMQAGLRSITPDLRAALCSATLAAACAGRGEARVPAGAQLVPEGARLVPEGAELVPR